MDPMTSNARRADHAPVTRTPTVLADDPGDSTANPSGDPAFVRSDPRGGFTVAAIGAPWGPIHIAATRQAVVGLAVLSPREPFVDDVVRRTGMVLDAGASGVLDRAVAAVEEFLEGDPTALGSLALDLADRGRWDRNVLAGVRTLGWGEVTSYGRLARSIGRRGAARAVGGSVGRNPIGLAIPCHRIIAGDGTIGGYGADWFGGRDELVSIKRELLAREGVSLPAGTMRD